MFDISLGGAALAGILSFLSPCILPLVPFYLCYMAGANIQQLSADGTVPQQIRVRVFIASMLFSAGVIIVFMGMGAVATSIGQFVREWFSTLRIVAAALIFLMGLHFLGVFRIALFNQQFRTETQSASVGYVGAFFMGLAFAFGWTPCVGPVLAAILMTASAEESVSRGVSLLFVYGAAMTFPFILAALFIGPFLRWMAGFRQHLDKVEKAMGVFLILFAILIGTNSMNFIAQWMLSIAPDIGVLR